VSAKRYTRSVGQLKGVTRCGEAFRLSRGIGVPRAPQRPAPWTGLGIALHEAFQRWELSERKDDVVNLFEVAYDAWVASSREKQPNLDLWILPPGTKSTEAGIKNYRKRGVEKDVPIYRDRRLEAEWEILRLPSGEQALELEFEIDLEGVTVKGSIDLIQWWPRLGMAALEDVKTGSPDDDDDYRQLNLYALAAHEVCDIDLTHGRFWYTKLDRPGPWKEMKQSRDYLVEQYRKADRIIDEQLFLPRPGKHCGLCDVKPFCSELGWLKPGEALG
jgi:putative RecB family exonuclease